MGRARLTGQSGGGGSNIKSIQRGLYDMVSATQVTINIFPIDTNASIVRITFNGTGKVIFLSRVLMSCKILNSTQIELKRDSSNIYSAQPIYWEVIEFNNVKSIQNGSVAMDVNSKNIAINTVELSKSMMFYNIWSTSLNSDSENTRLGGYLLNNTVIKFEGYAPQSYGISVNWQVIEFK